MHGQEFFSIVETRVAKGSCLPGTVKRMQKSEICIKCQDQYREKYPNQPFKIRCDGVWEDDDIEELSNISGELFDEVKEQLNPAFWAEKNFYVLDDDGQKNLVKLYWYQKEILRCTSYNKVDRLARGLGKTMCGIIEELHSVIHQRNYHIVVVTPNKSQAQDWFSQIRDLIYNSDNLSDTLAGTPKQAPYFEFKFRNGSWIRIFCTGAKEAKTLRGQSPRKVRMDEQDYLADNDYKAIQPLFRRFPNSRVHGSSTPTGARAMYWNMCRKDQKYKEFHFPITVKENWNSEMEEDYRREARTELNYQHEFLAEFGALESGVFKPEYVDSCLQEDYRYSQLSPTRNDQWKYFMGVDWNGQGTGTKIRIVGYNPDTKIRMLVDTYSVTTSQLDSIEQIRKANKRWHCEEIYIDKGFGNVQDELMKLIGQKATDPDDRRMLDIKTIDFGATIKTNKLVPNRDKRMYINSPENELDRSTKPFLVEGFQILVEQGMFRFSPTDTILEDQMRAYKVKNYSSHGWANTYVAVGNVGDHDLDATMLAVLGIEIKYGLFVEYSFQNKPVSGVQYISAIGSPLQEPASTNPEVAQHRLEQANVPSRTNPASNKRDPQIVWAGRNSYITAPASPPKTPTPGSRFSGSTPSRTSVFRNPRRFR